MPIKPLAGTVTAYCIAVAHDADTPTNVQVNIAVIISLLNLVPKEKFYQAAIILQLARYRIVI
jgi:hypothetical protein